MSQLSFSAASVDKLHHCLPLPMLAFVEDTVLWKVASKCLTLVQLVKPVMLASNNVLTYNMVGVEGSGEQRDGFAQQGAVVVAPGVDAHSAHDAQRGRHGQPRAHIPRPLPQKLSLEALHACMHIVTQPVAVFGCSMSISTQPVDFLNLVKTDVWRRFSASLVAW